MPDFISKAIDDLCREAVICNDCFDGRLRITRTRVDFAQPRWIGPRYWSSKPRVLIVLTNPGSGNARDGSADLTFRQRLLDYRQGKTDLRPVFEHQKADMRRWRDLFPFYMEGFGLHVDETAFINIAWCASVSETPPRKKKNDYPKEMLRHCFGKFTSGVVRALDPQLLILGGGEAQTFEARLKVLVPNVEFVRVLHYSARWPRDLLKRPAQIERVRAVLACLR